MSENKKDSGISRRSFLGIAGLAGVGVATAGLAGCAPKSTTSSSTTTGTLSTTLAAGNDGLPSFFNTPAAISKIATTKTYDVVVIGAGAAGLPAALSAKEAGASVALLQKASQAISQGNSGTGVDLANSDPAGVAALTSLLIKDSANRTTRALAEMWAKNSGEAVKWVIKKAAEGGAQVVDQGNLQQATILNIKGYGPMNYVTSFFGPKPYTVGEGMRALANTAAKEGVEIFYSTPAQQLVTSNGAVTGVIAKAEDGSYIQFNANKGVIMATGDYQNDVEMSNYYLPDLQYFDRKQDGKTGDGHKMIVWAGGRIENLNHTKMLHDFDAGPASMCDMPFLDVNADGNRFVNETVEMSLLSNYLRQQKNTGWYSQIFDSTYMTFAASWPGKLVDPQGLKAYEPDDTTTEKTGVFKDLIRTYVCNTLDELAQKIKVDPTNLKNSVARYNELATLGKDLDFGVPPQYLHTIAVPPFYAINRHLRISAICSGAEVNENCQCLTPSGSPIKGLYAVGNCSGNFYGGVDYPLTVYGLSLGRCYTQGYVIGKYVAKL